MLLIFIATSISFNWSQEVKRTIPVPTNAQALFKENSAKITKDLETKTGLPMSKLKLVKTLPEWYRFFGPKNEEYGYPWPEELISNYWEYETPKDANGMYKTISVAIVYTRLNCDKYPCLLTNTYTLDYIAVSDAFDAGHKQITEEQSLALAIHYFKSGKASAFDNMVKINKINIYNPTYVSATSKILKFNLSGELGLFNPDKTTLLNTMSKSFSFNLHVTYSGNSWNVDSLVMQDIVPTFEMLETSYNVAAQNEFYQSYQKAGFDAIYQTSKKTDKPNGMDEKLYERTTAFYALVKAKGANLTKEDLASFIEPSINYDAYPAENKADANFTKLKTATSINLLKESKIESGVIEIKEVKLSNGKTTMLPIGIVYNNNTVQNYKTKKYYRSTFSVHFQKK